ncbi:RNI-like protein [Gigaspora margarita]|uniref:RNI-like protein n=1 Tax=Gigaspora margarita TaxID=4874 RepID=A0A8H3X7L1_GIGMA|nr:RNI-like protein [Gigaspora margarita]
MAPFLPADVLCQIFQNLTDQKSLYSCLLVNRLWCATSVEYLWSKPFRFIYTCNFISCTCHKESRISRSSKLIEIYLSCLTEKEKILLLENGIKLPIESPLFDYAGFIRYLDLDDFYIAIRDWMESNIILMSSLMDYDSKQQLILDFGGNSLKKQQKKFKLSKVVRYITKSLGGVSLGVGRRKNNDKSDSDSTSIDTTITTSSSILSTSIFSSSTPVTPTSPTTPLPPPSSSSSSSILLSLNPRERLVTEVLCRLLMRRSSTLKQLSIDRTYSTRNLDEFRCSSLPPLLDRFQNTRPVPDQFMMLPTYPGAISCLSSLSELICTTRQSKRKLFDLLSEISTKIHKISVMMDYSSNNWHGTRLKKDDSDLEDEAKSLATLIRVQQSLQHFEIYCCENGSNIIISALKSQSNNLKSLSFIDVRFWGWDPLDFISNCHDLKKLIFKSCSGLTNDLLDSLIDSEFPQLTTIEMENTSAPVHILESLIKHGNSNILTLNLGQYKTTLNNSSSSSSSSSSSKIIETVANHCPNLISFKSFIESDEIPQLVSLFTLCTNLQSVTINGPRSPEIDVNHLFLELSSQELPNLKDLSILGSWSFQSYSLNQFLSGSKPPLKSLQIQNSRCFTDSHLEVILKNLCSEISSKNTLKDLRLHVTCQLNEDLVDKVRDYVKEDGFVQVDYWESVIREISVSSRKVRKIPQLFFNSFINI